VALTNTDTNYGSIAKWLHWGIALLFLASYCSVYYRQWFTDQGTEENWMALHLHVSVGISIGALVVLRIIWRSLNEKPKPESGSKLSHLAARLGHYALYGAMILMPVTGYLGTGTDTEFFFSFDIPKFESTSFYTLLVADWMGLDFDTFEAPVDCLHKEILGKWLVWMLIAGHAAAGYHHVVKRDRTLAKMTTGN